MTTYATPIAPPAKICSKCGISAAQGARFSWRTLSRTFNSWCTACVVENKHSRPTPPPELPRADLALSPVLVVLRRTIAVQHMSTRERWLAFADQCELHATAAGNAQTTMLLLDQARDWRALANNPVYIQNGRASEEDY